MRPYDRFGHTTRVRGTIHVQLFGSQTKQFGHSPRLQQLEHWARHLSKQPFDEVVGYRVPLRTNREFERNDTLGLWGHISIELTVFGQGSFREDRLVRFRSWHPLRDTLRLHGYDHLWQLERFHGTSSGRLISPMRN